MSGAEFAAVLRCIDGKISEAERCLDDAMDGTVHVASDVLDRERYRIGVLDEVRQAVKRLADTGEAMAVAAAAEYPVEAAIFDGALYTKAPEPPEEVLDRAARAKIRGQPLWLLELLEQIPRQHRPEIHVRMGHVMRVRVGVRIRVGMVKEAVRYVTRDEWGVRAACERLISELEKGRADTLQAARDATIEAGKAAGLAALSAASERHEMERDGRIKAWVAAEWLEADAAAAQRAAVAAVAASSLETIATSAKLILSVSGAVSEWDAWSRLAQIVSEAVRHG